MHPFLAIADRAARQAGKIILTGLDRLDRIRIQQKANHCGVVTEVDLEAEKVIIATIRKAYPQHGILAEETGMILGDSYTWIIDPLDGTCNFIHDFPHFAVSIAVKNQEKRCIECALIYNPLNQETFTAERGHGAYINNTQRFPRRLRVSNQLSIEKSLLGVSIPSRGISALPFPLNQAPLRDLITQASGMRRTGSAVLDLAYVAAGRLDGALELNLEPWDIAAGALLVQEAGGIACDLQGQENHFNSGHIVAANPKLCPLLLRAICGKNKKGHRDHS